MLSCEASMRKCCRAVAWLLFVAVAILSVVPPSFRPTTDVPHNWEHLSIFFATGAALGIGYPGRGWTIATLIAFSGGIEVIQLLVPGRHARVSDFIIDATASCLGIGLVYSVEILRKAAANNRPAPPRG
jgi:hypothetical protein